MSSAGQEAVECAALAGLVLDEWQQFVLHHGLGEDPDGRWSAFRNGVCVPRQNGKGGIIEALELFWLFVLGERLVIHSAHRYDTSMEAFRRLRGLIQATPEFDSRVARYSTSHGTESIELKSGQRVQFRTRSKDGGRGFTGDKIVLDEAMDLKEQTMADLLPTLSARPNPQVWFLGSAVDQVSMPNGVVFAKVRADAQAGAERLMYAEWSVDVETPDDLTLLEAADPDRWADANPALGIRITENYVRDEMGTLGARAFAVERLGVGDWPRTDGLADSAIDWELWKSLDDRRSEIAGPIWFAIDVSPDRARSCVSAAGKRSDGRFHVEVVKHGRGTGWVVEECVRLQSEHHPEGFITDSVGPAASLLPELEQAGVKVDLLTQTDHAQACGFLFDRTQQDQLRHLGTDELNLAVKGVARRPLGESWAWSRKDSTVDITPLVSCTFALWGASRERKQEVLVAWA